MRRILNQITPEKKAEMFDKRQKEIESLTLSFQLGCFVGEYIVTYFLPTISIDMIHTNNNIKVTSDEHKEYEELDKAWCDKRLNNEPSDGEWNNLRSFRVKMNKKYLPDVLRCFIPILNLKDIDITDFKNGIRTALFNCDICHYSLNHEDITIEQDKHLYFTIIELKLRTE